MKCDELNAYKGDVYIPVYGSIADADVYLKKDVDSAIAELKEAWRSEHEACEALKAKLETVNELVNESKELLKESQKMHQRCADNASKQIRRLKRALWIARANRAMEKIAWFKLWNISISTMNPEDSARQEFDKWKKALGKFLKKTEEYK